MAVGSTTAPHSGQVPLTLPKRLYPQPTQCPDLGRFRKNKGTQPATTASGVQQSVNIQLSSNAYLLNSASSALPTTLLCTDIDVTIKAAGSRLTNRNVFKDGRIAASNAIKIGTANSMKLQCQNEELASSVPCICCKRQSSNPRVMPTRTPAMIEFACIIHS